MLMFETSQRRTRLSFTFNSCTSCQVRLHRGDGAAQHVGEATEASPAGGTSGGGPIWAGVHTEGRNLDHHQQQNKLRPIHEALRRWVDVSCSERKTETIYHQGGSSGEVLQTTVFQQHDCTLILFSPATSVLQFITLLSCDLQEETLFSYVFVFFGERKRKLIFFFFSFKLNRVLWVDSWRLVSLLKNHPAFGQLIPFY